MICQKCKYDHSTNSKNLCSEEWENYTIYSCGCGFEWKVEK